MFVPLATNATTGSKVPALTVNVPLVANVIALDAWVLLTPVPLTVKLYNVSAAEFIVASPLPESVTVEVACVNVPLFVNNVPDVPANVNVGVPVAVIVPALLIFSVVTVSVEALATVKVLLARIDKVSPVYELLTLPAQEERPSTPNAPLVTKCITSSSAPQSY